MPWFSLIDLSLPFWNGYRALLLQLQKISVQNSILPSASQLQNLLPDQVVNQSGRPITFRPSQVIPGVQYEKHIFQTGEVSTRENNWHDLFNALVWSRFPGLKSVMNGLHCQEIQCRTGLDRGPLRDALTLFDESGVIVVSANKSALFALAERDWHRVFRQHAALWQEEIQVLVCGHALLEKFLKPYKSLTAQAVLVHVDASFSDAPQENFLQALDARMAVELLAGRLFQSTAGLSALPLMGIPGWWPEAGQDEAFYSDCGVFRRPGAGFTPAPVFGLAEAADHQDMP